MRPTDLVDIYLVWEYFRLHERIRILPGVHVNVSKRGLSLSLGEAGATLNLSKRGTRTTIGLPGTGLSYIENEPWRNSSPAPSPVKHHHWVLWLFLVLAALWLLGSLLPPPPAHAETLLRCSTWQGYKVCQGSNGYRSWEWSNAGRRYGDDNAGNKWMTFNGVGGEITINRGGQ